jgi:hypothetical protein
MKETAIERVKDDRFLLDLAHGKGNLNAVLQNLAIRHIAGEPVARQLYEEIQSGQYKNDSTTVCNRCSRTGCTGILMELALSETTAPLPGRWRWSSSATLGKGKHRSTDNAQKQQAFSWKAPEVFRRDARRGGANACARLSGKSVFELAAETENESFLSRQIGLLLRKSDANDERPTRQ